MESEMETKELIENNQKYSDIHRSIYDALTFYVQQGQYDQLQQLLQNEGSNFELLKGIDDNGCTLLQWAAINNRVEIASFLISKGVEVNQPGGKLNEIPLIWASRNDKFTLMIHLLIRNKSYINYKNVHGHTALHIAARSGNIHIAFILLNNGAEIDAIDLHGNTPLYCLLLYKNISLSVETHRQMVKLLLNFGADVLHKNFQGETAMHILCSFKDDFDPYIALEIMEYCGYSSSNKIANCLEIRNFDGLTPYQVAAKSRNLRVILFFNDAYLYRILPREFPILLIGFQLLLSCMIIHYYGWQYGSITVILLLYPLSKGYQDNIIKGRSRLHLGFALGLILCYSWSYATFVSPYMTKFTNLGTAALILSITYSLILSSYTKPNHLSPQPNRSELYTAIVKVGLKEGLTEAESSAASNKFFTDYIENDHELFNPNKSISPSSSSIFKLDVDENPDIQLEYINTKVAKLCTSCLCNKAEASTHCYKCGHCMIDLDHHCDFVNNCIGQGNRRIFVIFTILASIGCGWCGIISFYTEYYILDHMLIDSQTNALFMVNAIMSILTSMWVGAIFIGQMITVASETTTFEVIKRRHKKTCSCDRKAISNLFIFFLTGKYKVTPQIINSHNRDKCDCDHSHANNNSNTKLLHHGDVDKDELSTKSSNENEDCDMKSHTSENVSQKKHFSWGWLFGKNQSLSNRKSQMIAMDNYLNNPDSKSQKSSSLLENNSLSVARRNIGHHVI